MWRNQACNEKHMWKIKVDFHVAQVVIINNLPNSRMEGLTHSGYFIFPAEEKDAFKYFLIKQFSF